MRPTEFKPGQLWRRSDGSPFLVVSLDNQITFIHSMTDIRVSGNEQVPLPSYRYVGEFVGFRVAKKDSVTS